MSDDSTIARGSAPAAAAAEDRFRARLLGNIESHTGAEIAALLMVSDTMLCGCRPAVEASTERAIAKLERAAGLLGRGTGEGPPERDLTRERIAEIRRKMAEKAGRAEPPRAADLIRRTACLKEHAGRRAAEAGRASLAARAVRGDLGFLRHLNVLRWFRGRAGGAEVRS